MAIFPGNVAEYERFRNYNVEIIDLNPQNPDKRFFYESFLSFPYGSYKVHIETSVDTLEMIGNIKKRRGALERILDTGIEAIVNLDYLPGERFGFRHNTLIVETYGLPVRKVKEK